MYSCSERDCRAHGGDVVSGFMKIPVTKDEGTPPKQRALRISPLILVLLIQNCSVQGHHIDRTPPPPVFVLGFMKISVTQDEGIPPPSEDSAHVGAIGLALERLSSAPHHIFSWWIRIWWSSMNISLPRTHSLSLARPLPLSFTHTLSRSLMPRSLANVNISRECQHISPILKISR